MGCHLWAYCKKWPQDLESALYSTLQWCHNGRDGISTHQPHGCLLNHLFGHRSKKTSKLRVTGLCVGNSPVTGEFPAQMASNGEDVSIWWHHHDTELQCKCVKWILHHHEWRVMGKHIHILWDILYTVRYLIHHTSCLWMSPQTINTT